MFHQKSGYVGHAMSVRAKEAYEAGLVTKSTLKKEDLQRADIQLPVGFVKWLMTTRLTPSEWHHTSTHFNETDFYDLNIIKEELKEMAIDDLKEAYQASRKQTKKEEQALYYAYISYGEWEGSRKHPKLKTYEAFAVIQGDWAYLDSNQKKKLSGKHITIIKRYKIKPKEMSYSQRNRIMTYYNLKKARGTQ